MKNIFIHTKKTPMSIFGAASLFFISLFVHAEPSQLKGAEVFNNNCARCHNARSIDEFSLAEWTVIMPHMREKAHLTGKETDAVMKFIALVKTDPSTIGKNENIQSVLSGDALFTKYSCQGCHSINGVGGSVGPELDSVIADKGKMFFLQKLKNPQFNNPSSPMPKMPLDDEEINALADYLSSL